MALMPGEPLMSTDNLRSMRVDNVRKGSGPDLHTLGITPTGVAAIVPTYLLARQGTT